MENPATNGACETKRFSVAAARSRRVPIHNRLAQCLASTRLDDQYLIYLICARAANDSRRAG